MVEGFTSTFAAKLCDIIELNGKKHSLTPSFLVTLRNKYDILALFILCLGCDSVNSSTKRVWSYWKITTKKTLNVLALTFDSIGILLCLF